jgi:glycolate oxidase
MASYQDIRIVPAVARIMEGLNIRYGVLGERERCCGYIAYLAGMEREFMAIMDENLKLFERHGSPVVISTCAGCHKTFKDLYPKYAGNKVPKVMHIVEYLEGEILEGRLQFKNPFQKKTIYHDPCDLGRHLGLYEQPRRILKAIPEIELLEFNANRALAKCCGGGGGMKAYSSAMSDEIAYKRTIQAHEAGAEVIVSACPSCKRNLQTGAGRLRKEKRSNIQVMDITELIARAI